MEEVLSNKSTAATGLIIFIQVSNCYTLHKLILGGEGQCQVPHYFQHPPILCSQKTKEEIKLQILLLETER